MSNNNPGGWSSCIQTTNVPSGNSPAAIGGVEWAISKLLERRDRGREPLHGDADANMHAVGLTQ